MTFAIKEGIVLLCALVFPHPGYWVHIWTLQDDFFSEIQLAFPLGHKLFPHLRPCTSSKAVFTPYSWPVNVLGPFFPGNGRLRVRYVTHAELLTCKETFWSFWKIPTLLSWIWDCKNIRLDSLSILLSWWVSLPEFLSLRNGARRWERILNLEIFCEPLLQLMPLIKLTLKIVIVWASEVSSLPKLA